MPEVRRRRSLTKEHNDLRQRRSNGEIGTEELRRLKELDKAYFSKLGTRSPTSEPPANHGGGAGDDDHWDYEEDNWDFEDNARGVPGVEGGSPSVLISKDVSADADARLDRYRAESAENQKRDSRVAPTRTKRKGEEPPQGRKHWRRSTRAVSLPLGIMTGAGEEALSDPSAPDWDDVMDALAEVHEAQPATVEQSDKRLLSSARGENWKPYWIRVESDLLERRDLPDGAKLLYAWLVNQSHVQRDWKKPFAPGNKLMAKKLGTSEKRVGRHLTVLEKAGLIAVQRRGARNASIITVFPTCA